MPQPQPASRRTALLVVMGEDGHLHVGSGGHVRVHVASVHYASSVIDDLCRIAGLPAGAALLHGCDTVGRRILILQPETAIEPPNGTVEPEDRVAATACGRPTGQTTENGAPLVGSGTGSGSVIRYDPAEWPWQGDPASLSSADVLRALLRQATVNAEGADDPTDGLTCLAKGD